MQCKICGASQPKLDKPCKLCGYTATASPEQQWDRSAEASAINNLREALLPGETLLGLTRGRLGGDWRRTVPIAQRPYAAPYVNMGITEGRLMIQTIHNGTAEPLAFQGNGIPLSDIASMTISTTELEGPEHCARLSATLAVGSSFRLKAFGRLANGAADVVQIWRSLANTSEAEPEIRMCPICAKPLDGEYKHCPYCGSSTTVESASEGGN